MGSMLVMCDEIALRLVCHSVVPLLPSVAVDVSRLGPSSHHAESMDMFRRSGTGNPARRERFIHKSRDSPLRGQTRVKGPTPWQSLSKPAIPG